MTWTCRFCGGVHAEEPRTAAEREAWIETAWAQVLGAFGGVLSPQKRHDSQAYDWNAPDEHFTGPGDLHMHVCARCATFEARQKQRQAA